MSDVLLKAIMDEIKEMKANMVTKGDLKNFATKDDIKKLEEVVADIPFIKAAVQELAVKVDNLTGRVDIIEKEMVRKKDLEYIYHKIAEHDREIFYLKSQS